MVTVPGSTPSPQADASSEDLGNAITVLVARIDEQFRITERIDAKGRQVFAVCAAFYVGAQTLAFTIFGEDDVDHLERASLSATALVATIALVYLAQRLLDNERLREERLFDAGGIVSWFEQANNDAYVSRQLVHNLAHVADERVRTNEHRVAGYNSVLASARWALLLTALEAAVAVVVRV
ncbi:MAG TPA: hypothetical protein VMS60_16050 [Solirubrobacterales bacterium]|nr:hypothetical protein [Solirubrobacterales bacterium]